MANVQPVSLAKAVFDRLTQAAGRNFPNEFEIRGLENDARALMKTEPDKAHQVLGALCALRFDVDGLKRHHEQAVKLGDSVWRYRNYAVSLQIVGLFEQAAHYGLLAAEAQPENLTFLRSAAGYFLWIGNVKKALALREALQQRNPDEPIEQIQTLKDLLALMDRHGIEEEELKGSMYLAFALLRQKRLRPVDCGVTVLGGDEDCAFFQISIDLPAIDVQRLDAELGRQLSGSLPEMNSAVVVEYVPLSVSARAHDSQAARPS